MKDGQEVYRVPVLAVAHRLSNIEVQSFSVQSSELDAEGSAATLTLTNRGKNAGDVEIFNFIGKDGRKPVAGPSQNADCDLQAAGYRIVRKANDKNVMTEYLQMAIKTYKPMTTWNNCDVSVLVDHDGDDEIDIEVLGAHNKIIPGERSEEFSTTTLDFKKIKALRKEFEARIESVKAELKDDPKKLIEQLRQLKDEEKYDSAYIDRGPLVVYNNSSVMVLETELKHVRGGSKASVAVKILTSSNESSALVLDDHLIDDRQQSGEGQALSLMMDLADQVALSLPEKLTLAGGKTESLELTMGRASGSLLVLLPQNRKSVSDYYSDLQAVVVAPQFKFSAPQ
jgi:hypothetical protein